MKHPKLSRGFLLGGFLMMSSLAVQAQQKFTISGTVKDKANGEALIGTVISIKEQPSEAVEANEYGFYSLTVEQGTCNLKSSYDGFQEQIKTITLLKDTVINWDLEETSLTVLEEVVITGSGKDDNLTKSEMGTTTLTMKEISKIPVLLGEKDVLKTIQLLPGVKGAGEGNSGFSVRGGATDQNLIQLDEAPVYNASHLLGFFSTFNSDAIKEATIIKGNSPSQYGGRLSSVLDVKMREGNSQKYNVSGGIGAISSRLTVEGPIQKEKSSFMISGRRTYADVFLKLTDDFKDNTLYFYDLNAKANYKINNKHRIYLSGYFGRDVLGFGSTFGIDWGNSTGTLRWNYIISSKLFANTSFIFSDYKYNIKIKSGENDFKIQSNIRDWNLKQEYSYYLNPKNSIRFGFNIIHHTLKPSTFTGSIASSEEKPGKKALEYALFANNSWKVNEKLSIDYGIRGTAYTILSGATYNIYDKGVKTDSVVLSEGEFGKTQYTIEPRITANYRLRKNISLKTGYARNGQHLHLLSNSSGGNPTDQWIGNSYNIKPEIADQISVGYSQNFSDNKYELGIESYYKSMQNQIDYKDGADLQSEPDVESQLLFGKGRAYGLEMILKKKEGKFTGWISYTLSKTERKIEGINHNEWYNAKQDRTHDLSIVASYQLTPKWSVSSLFIYNTGNAVTFPTGKYTLNGHTIYQYGNRNADRMPSTHRLDLSFTREMKTKKGRETSISFGCYNVYGHRNPYSISFRQNATNPQQTEAVQLSLFRWVPNITYNFKF